MVDDDRHADDLLEVQRNPLFCSLQVGDDACVILVQQSSFRCAWKDL